MRSSNTGIPSYDSKSLHSLFLTSADHKICSDKEGTSVHLISLFQNSHYSILPSPHQLFLMSPVSWPQPLPGNPILVVNYPLGISQRGRELLYINTNCYYILVFVLKLPFANLNLHSLWEFSPDHNWLQYIQQAIDPGMKTSSSKASKASPS